MELYLDSANIQEIEDAFSLGFLYGLTTTPTFMFRDGITNVDEIYLKLASIVPVLQVEALGNTAEEILAEAQRILSLGLDKDKTVFKIPVSLEGAKACKLLVDRGYLVNVHLIYTVQQAYIALSAGATYVCPLVGRLQDQGHDGLSLVEQCVDIVDRYGYDSRIMFSSVRHPEHVRNALNIGAHAVTVPMGVLKQLTQNYFTDIGIKQFNEHTRLTSMKVADVIRKDATMIHRSKGILDALVVMSVSKLGAVTVLNEDGRVLGVFTDGDLRRYLEMQGESFLHKTLGELEYKYPVTIDAEASLYEASRLIKEKRVDTLVAIQEGYPVGMLDIQDLLGS